MGTSDTSRTPASDEIAALKARLTERETTVTSQAALIAILEEKLRLATHQQFAPASEKLSSLGQMNLFNEAEAVNRHRTLTPDRRAILTPLLCCLPMWQG